MSQHDFALANDTGANVRGDIEDAAQALASTNSGASEPADTFPRMLYATSGSGGFLKIRNAADTAWITTAIYLDTNFQLGGAAGSQPVLGAGGIKFADTTVQATAYPGNTAYKAWTTVWTTTSNTWTDVGGAIPDTFDCAITPKSASNEILVHVKLMFSFDEGTGSPVDTRAPMLKVVRGATDVDIGSGASWEDVGFAYASGASDGTYFDPTYKLFCVNATFIDTPATTSATTYKVQVKLPYATMSFTANETEGSLDTYGTIRGASSIVLQELNAVGG